MSPLGRRLLGEVVGTALLGAAVVGSGIAAARRSPGDVGLQLLENAVATAGALVAIILAVGPVSGAHLNPVVTLVDRCFGGVAWRDAAGYVGAQVAGAVAGVVVANLMFGLRAVELSETTRSGGGQWLGEVVSTFGLLLVVFGGARSGRAAAAVAVGAYIGAAYWFTSSTSFANPALTVARTISDTFAGIAWWSAPAFLVAELVGGLVAVATLRALHPGVGEVAGQVAAPHPHPADGAPAAALATRDDERG